MGKWADPTDDSLAAKTLRLVTPGYSYCLKCGMPWKYVDGHTTNYTDSKGCFPLCEKCWKELGCPEARIPYYATLVELWEQEVEVSDREKRQIMLAVAEGK